MIGPVHRPFIHPYNRNGPYSISCYILWNIKIFQICSSLERVVYEIVSNTLTNILHRVYSIKILNEKQSHHLEKGFPFYKLERNALCQVSLCSSLIWGQFHKRFCAPTPNFCALCPTFEKLFTGAKVRRKVQKFGLGRETVYEIDPRSIFFSLNFVYSFRHWLERETH